MPEKTDWIEKNDNHVVLIKDVPCAKCRQCGEAFFNIDVVQKIEGIMNGIQFISSDITLTVLDYLKYAA